MFHFLCLELCKILWIFRVQQEIYQPNVCKMIAVLCSIYMSVYSPHIIEQKLFLMLAVISRVICFAIIWIISFWILWLVNLFCFCPIQSVNCGMSVVQNFRVWIKFESSSLLSPRSANPCLTKKIFTKHRRFNSTWLAVDSFCISLTSPHCGIITS